MPYAKHLRVVWGGKLREYDVWQNQVNMNVLDAVTDGEWEQAAASCIADVADEIVAYHDEAGSKYPTNAKLGWVKVNAIGPDGLYISDTDTNLITFGTPYIGGAGSSSNPNDVALCVSLRAAAMRGYATHGRFYIPAPAITVDDTTGLWGSTPCTAAATAAADFLQALNAVTATVGTSPSECAVVLVSGNASQKRAVTRVLVGNHADTQRRRDNATPETYYESTV